MQKESQQISHRLLGIFESVAEAYGAHRNTFLEQVSAYGVDTSILKQEYAQRMKTQLADVPPLEFGVAGPLWPNIPRLLDCDVIMTTGTALTKRFWSGNAGRPDMSCALRAALFSAVRQEAESLPTLLCPGEDSEEKLLDAISQHKNGHRERAKELQELAAQATALLSEIYQEEG